MVGLAVGSMVDRSRSVGFQSSAGVRVCVAPVVDMSMHPGSPSNLYAYGFDCCNHRGGFRCDDAGDPMARFGMVLPDPADVLPPLLDTLAPGTEDLEAAVKLQQAAYGRRQAASRHIFMQYVADPFRVKMGYVDSAMIASVTCSLVFLMALCLCVGAMVLGTNTVGSWLKRSVV